MKINTKSARLMPALVILLFSVSASADVHIIPDHGGAVLGATGQPFTIYPYYLGSGWGSINPPSDAVRAHQEYLAKLASFISGQYLPSGIDPFTKQYRVVAGASAGPAAGDVTAAPAQLSNAQIQTIITNAQATPPADIRHLPAYASNVLIMVFPATPFTPGANSCAGGELSGAYHCAADVNKFYGVVFGINGATTASTVSHSVSHEVIEAATDPIIGTAWEDIGPALEVCDTNNANSFMYNGIKIWSCFDNSLSGAQTTTGLDPPTAFDPVSFIVPETSLLLL